MTLQFKRDLQALIEAVQGVLAECHRQGSDETGYIHYLEAVTVEKVQAPLALVRRHLLYESKKHGDFKYLRKGGDDAQSA